jgi:hypothetical protein
VSLIRILRPRRQSGWDDPPADPLVAALEALASAQTDVTARVDRQRTRLRAAFVQASVRGAAPVRARSSFAPRRLAFALSTALLLVVMTAGGIAASGPGLPLYGVRLAAEELFLPPGGMARVTAQLDRLDDRLDEVSRALAADDAAAAAAALVAYDRIAGELLSGSRPAPQDRAAVQARLTAQLRHLEQIQAADPLSGPKDAITRANAVLAWLVAPGPDGGTPGPTGATPSPTASPTPAATSEPQPTPQGSSTADPSASPSRSGPPGPSGSANGSGPPGPSGSAGLTVGSGPSAPGGEH